MSPHCAIKKRELGAYYTPPELSQILVDWAIRSPTETILEPSFGGCGFLESCKTRLEILGQKKPLTKLFGADIDDKAFEHLNNIFGPSIISQKFIKNDFMSIANNEFKINKFDVVLGNPPYVSLHNMTIQQRKKCFEVLKRSPFVSGNIGTNASLWGFFLIHSLSFSKDGGRMVWVLPSSLLHAKYAKVILDIYKKHFSSLKIVKLNQRFFKEEGTEEVSVILAAEGFSKEPIDENVTGIYVAKDTNTLNEILESKVINEQDQVSNHKVKLLNEKVLTNYNFLSSKSLALGDISRVVIGMVTGANGKFIINQSSFDELELSDDDVRPIVSKFHHLSGLTHTKARHNKMLSADKRCLLICPPNLDGKSTPIRRYLATVERSNRKNNRTFPKRPLWYFPDDGRFPDAFLSYMIDSGPRLVLNTAKINCTNTIHRVFFNKGISFRAKKAIAISMLSSFTRLSAELCGRSYGSGVLKLEPSAGKELKIIFSENLLLPLLSINHEVDDLLCNGNVDAASKLVDELLSLHFDEDFEYFRNAINILKKDRYES